MLSAPSLHEWQQHFMNAVYGQYQADDGDWIVGAGLDPAARLRIYQHSSEQIHAGALGTVYPATLALVGEAYFEQVAHRFRMVHPATLGNLQCFGEGLGDFLESLPETQGLPYLGDVARLEWLRQEVVLAVDASTLSTDEFVRALACAEGNAHIALHPSIRLFASRHPVVTLWRYALQPDGERLRLTGTGEHVLLWREAGQVAMAVLEAASFACIEALARGLSLHAAHGAAHSVDPSFDLLDCMASLLESGLVVAFHPNP